MFTISKNQVGNEFIKHVNKKPILVYVSENEQLTCAHVMTENQLISKTSKKTCKNRMKSI